MGYIKNLQYTTEYCPDSFQDYDEWREPSALNVFDMHTRGGEIDTTVSKPENDDSILEFFGAVKCEYCNEIVKKENYNYNAHMCNECAEDRKLRHE